MMKRILILSLAAALVPGGTILAQSPSKGVVNDPPKAAAALTPTQESLLRLTPRSDLLATIDLRQLLVDLLPRAEKLNSADITSMTAWVTKLAASAGTDLTTLQQAVVGLTLDGFQASGVILGQGIDLNRARLELLLKLYKVEYKVEEHRSIPLLTILSPVRPVSLGPISLKTDDLTIAPLGERRLALGNPGAVRAVIDLQAAESKAERVSPLLVAALRETSLDGVLRFSFDLPKSLREEARNQGDLFESIAAVRVMHGNLNVSDKLDLSLDAIMRTGSPREAADLDLGLRGLLNLARALFGSDQAGNSAIKQALSSVRLSTRAADVALSLSLPGSILR